METSKDKPEQNNPAKTASVSQAELGKLSPNVMNQRYATVTPTPQSFNPEQVKGLKVDSASFAKAVERMEQNPGQMKAFKEAEQSKVESNYKKRLEGRGNQSKQQNQERGKTPDRGPER